MTDTDTTAPAALAPGEYAIIELFGHTTLVGRIAEVERFGTKMLCVEPLFRGDFLGPVFHGGAAIYRLTPCTAEVAFARQPREDYQLPPSIRATIPAALLPAPVAQWSDADIEGDHHHDGGEHDEPDPMDELDGYGRFMP